MHTGHCFEADTPVTLADGSACRIADLAIGDVILSYHERGKRLEPRAVSAVHESPPALMLQVRLSDGREVNVTHAHKLGGPAGWRAVGDLLPGDEVWSVDAGAAALAPTKVVSVVTVAPRGPVYDLSVEQTHTYFAAGVLAHNKQ